MLSPPARAGDPSRGASRHHRLHLIGLRRAGGPVHRWRGVSRGVDFAAPQGTGIRAVAAGVVTWAGPRGAFGNMIRDQSRQRLRDAIRHTYKVLVHVGETVQRGDVIGLVGSTGRSTGPHVHFEVLKDGRQVNPARFIALRAGTTGLGRRPRAQPPRTKIATSRALVAAGTVQGLAQPESKLCSGPGPLPGPRDEPQLEGWLRKSPGAISANR